MSACPHLLRYRLLAQRPMRHSVTWGILLLALLLRGLIPAGYMPQAGSAAGAGSALLPLELCHGIADTDDSVLVRWLAEQQAEGAQPPEPQPVAHAQSLCLFAVCLAHSALPAAPPAPWVAPQWPSFWGARHTVTVAAVARFLPLGARAPPTA